MHIDLIILIIDSCIIDGFDRLVGWLVGFYGISTFVGYLTPDIFKQISSSISNNSV